MKVLLLIDSLGTGGAEKSMIEYAKYLKENNHTLWFVCLNRRKISYEKEVLDSGIKIKYLHNKNFILNVKELNSSIREWEPDIVHSILVRSNVLLRISRLFLKKGRVVQSLVNTPYSLERKKDSRLPWQKFLLAKQWDKWTARLFPSFYHPITYAVYKHYKSIYKIKENYKIIYRGRHENNYLDNRAVNSDFILINVGRQEFAKGQIDILKALKYIEQKYGIKTIKLQILGVEGKLSNDLQDYIVNKNLRGRVEILGFVRDVEKRLTKASVFVFPSYYEGLGGALIEAFAAKLPCICSDLPVLKEVVGNKEGALFCPPGDFECLGEQILKLYRNRALKKRLSDYSYSRFQEKFKMENINNEMLNMYKDLLKVK